MNCQDIMALIHIDGVEYASDISAFKLCSCRDKNAIVVGEINLNNQIPILKSSSLMWQNNFREKPN